MNREECISLIKKEKLILLSRRIPGHILIPALVACVDNGIRLYESTFDHSIENPIYENKEKLIAIKKALGDKICLGAGTVLTKDEVKAAYDSGCNYIISPDSDEEVIEETLKLGMISIPGALTPTEIKHSWKIGADFVKVFPADDIGYHYFQNLQGPLGHIPLMATGGVNPVSIPEFLKRGVTAVGTGITVFRPDLIAAEDYHSIGILAKMHVDSIQLYLQQSTASEK